MSTTTHRTTPTSNNHPQVRFLGNSGVDVGPIALGTVPLSGLGGATTYADFEATVGAAIGVGIRYVDTAPGYGNGRAEHFLGHLVRTRDLPDKILVSTKVGRLLRTRASVGRDGTGDLPGVTWEGGLPFISDFDYTYDGIMRSHEDSLQRLGIDRIDILHVHDIGLAAHGRDSDMYWEQLRDGGYEALRTLRDTGTVRAISVGVNEVDAVLEMAGEFPLDACLVAGRYSLIHDQASDRLFPECDRLGVSVIAAGVFNSGILAAGSAAATRLYDYGNAPEEIVSLVRRIERVCAEFDVALPTAAIQFVDAHPGVTCVLVGAKTPAEIEANYAALNTPTPAGFWQRLKDEALLSEFAPVPDGN
ncbi:MAG: aldo/keto reductase [Pseudonocardiales bacterium]|nr:aldo/keto reductase [Pseudonocardiales bacterium]